MVVTVNKNELSEHIAEIVLKTLGTPYSKTADNKPNNDVSSRVTKSTFAKRPYTHPSQVSMNQCSPSVLQTCADLL